MPPGVTVVVGTLDLYKDVWPPLCHGLKKYWPDCPWPIVFITNRARPPAFSAARVGKDKNWTDRIGRGLRQIKSPVILWLTGDNWITAPPDSDALSDFADYVRSKRAAHVRLYPGWDHDTADGSFSDDPRLMVLSKRAPYRCSLKPAFWRRSVLLGLLEKGEEPWDFERKASKRSRRLPDLFLATADWGCFRFVTAADPSGDWVKSPVVKGRWTVDAKRYCELEGVKVDFSRHPVGKIIDPKLHKVDWVLP